MKQLFFYLGICVFALSCQNTQKESHKRDQQIPEQTATSTQNNFAVVWKWRTTDNQLVKENATLISKELHQLWQQGMVENAYYNATAQMDKFSNFPNISFTLRAASSSAAQAILNQLTVVKKGIASYQLFSTGTLWLSRKHETINKKGTTKSFVCIWKTIGKPTPSLTQAQNDSILTLWNQGKIENVYFDIKGIQTYNNTTDFVFYANTNSREEAQNLCETLPFFKNEIATYKLFEVGVFWMGSKQNN